MRISAIELDEWDGSKVSELRIENPKWSEIERSILNLDGLRHTIVTVFLSAKTYLTVGGGARSRYIVYVTYDNEVFFTLSCGPHLVGLARLVVGGQEGEYPASIIIDQKTTFRAVRGFCETGKHIDELTWLTR